MSLQPIYTAENCKVAFQLDWSFSIFWRERIDDDHWLEALKERTEPDGVRVLQHRFARAQHSLFLISTKPHLSPAEIARSVKGRLQNLLGASRPKAFQRNYSIRSTGSTKREKLDAYIASQLGHHQMADKQVEERFSSYQIHDDNVDLSEPRYGDHAQFWHNLHLSFVNEDRWREINDATVLRTRQRVIAASKAKGHLLSRAAIVPDHIHMTIGCGLLESPLDIALSYMNNVCHVHGMREVFQFSMYMGTFGEYDLGAIEQKVGAP